MKKTILLISSIILVLLMITGTVSAEEIRFEVSVNKTSVPLGQSIQLSLKFEDSKSIPAIELPDIDGFTSRYVGPSTMMSIVNGRMSSAVTHIYRLVPLKTGTFTVGPISFEHDNHTYVSNHLTMEVYDSSAGQSPSSSQQRDQQTSLKDRLFLKMTAVKSKAYINEVVPITIKLYVSGLSVRDIQYPEFSHEGFSVDQFSKPNQYKENRGGIQYDVVEFNTSAFGTRAGDLKLGPATLTANLVMKKSRGRSSIRDNFFGRDPFDDFFGRYETEPIELHTEETSVTVLPMPEENRPVDFNGAVGNFDINVNVSPAVIKTGDPVTLLMTVSGKGNFNTVNAPVLQNPADFKTYEPEVKQEGSRRTFEQIIIPTTDRVKEVPKVVFSFFDTTAGRYRTISKGPFPLTITRPDKKEELTILDAPGTLNKTYTRETLGRDIIYIKEAPGSLRGKGSYLYNNPLFLLLQIVPLLLFISVVTLKKRRDRLSTDVSYARRLKAPRKAGKGIKEAEQHLHNNMTQEFYDTVFKTLREYIGNRFHISTGGITVDEVELMLKNRTIDSGTLDKLKNIFTECDMARYAPAGLDSEKMGVTLKDLKEVIDYLERTK